MCLNSVVFVGNSTEFNFLCTLKRLVDCHCHGLGIIFRVSHIVCHCSVP
jgi:hypothetical protein